MDVFGAALNFPTSFCCNCSAPDCAIELQDTRVTRYFGIGGSETTFSLPVPVCKACRRSTRRRPSGFFAKSLVIIVTISVTFLVLFALSASAMLALWLSKQLLWVGAVLGLLLTFGFYRLRRARPPKTSFYQPVRIKAANLEVTNVTSAAGKVVFMKLAFTNAEYLTAFRAANQAAIDAGHVAAVKA